MILFTPKAWSLLRRLLTLAKEEMDEWEIHGYGRIEVVSPNLAIVDELAMPEQVASSTFIETDADQYTAWQRKHFELSGKVTDDQIEAINAEQAKWRFWWHSHGSMHASYSSTDWDQLKEFAESFGMFFGAVFTTDMSSKAYVAYCQPAAVAVEWGKCDLFVPADKETEERAEEMFRAVTKKEVAAFKKWDSTKGVGNKATVPFGDDGEEFEGRGCVTCLGLLVRELEQHPVGSGGSAVVAVFLCYVCDQEESLCVCNADTFAIEGVGALQ
jgi:hypothetical protein